MKIGFIGLGIMGESMALNIVKKHDDTVYVYDLDPKKIIQLENDGAVGVDSASKLAESSDIIITMVPNSSHVVSLYDEIIEKINKDKICIDMSTISPEVSIEVSKKIKAKGASFIDAPVVKSKPAAIKGELGIYAGGDKNVYDKINYILKYMGNNTIYLGENGNGLFMKIAHNALVAQIQNGVNEMLSFALKNGISFDDFVTSISYGGGQNFYLDGKNKSIKEGNYTTAFSVENMHKDLSIGVELIKGKEMELKGLENAKNVYDKALEKGYGKEDFSATFKLFQ